MPNIVLRAEGIGKKYILRHQTPGAGHTTLRDKIAEHAAAVGRWLSSDTPTRASPSREEFWALRDVSLKVEQGDVLGIVGRNGSGKSTLLKLISQITEPTEGRITLQGRVASLLEVGTGFHPELSGRENIFLNGAILGMTRVEIRKQFDQIVAFAEVEKFLDTPIKHYSSGMYIRLAFAVAAHLDPEILIVDEVLAVGDVAFQKKCLRRMNDAAREGRTIVLVSHNMLSIEALCTRAVWLHGGKVMATGEPHRIVSQYLRTSFSPLSQRDWRDKTSAPGNDQVRLHRALIRPKGGAVADPVRVCDAFVMEFEVWNLRPNTYLYVGIQFYNDHGILIFESAPVEATPWLGKPFPAGLFKFACHVPANLLNAGVHRVTLVVSKNEDVLLHKEDDILVFEVADSTEKRGGWYGSWDGAVRPILAWDTQLVRTDGAVKQLSNAG
jgi:lipopolysaccharide transport system ATP-binding protein